MSPTSITKSTFKLFKVTSSGTTQVTNVTVTLSSDGLKATLNPYGTSSTLLAANTRYKAVVTTGAKDIAGNALTRARRRRQPAETWTFTTRARRSERRKGRAGARAPALLLPLFTQVRGREILRTSPSGILRTSPQRRSRKLSYLPFSFASAR